MARARSQSALKREGRKEEQDTEIDLSKSNSKVKLCEICKVEAIVMRDKREVPGGKYQAGGRGPSFWSSTRVRSPRRLTPWD